MPKKPRPPQVYKTETQLKEEALIKQAAEAEALAAVHKSKLERRVENFWYHYKWQTIIGVFVLFLLVFFINDIFFRPKPDTTVVVVSTGYIDEDALSYMTSVLERYANDYNGDNKVMISADSIMLPNNFDAGQGDIPSPDLSDGQREMADMMKLMAILAAGTETIYLLDEYSYDYIIERGQDDDGHKIFDDFSIPAEKLGPEASGVFTDMRFYLRTAYSDESSYEYCKQILSGLNN